MNARMIFMILIFLIGITWMIVEIGPWNSVEDTQGFYVLPAAEPRAVIQYPNGTIELIEVADTEKARQQGLSGRINSQSMLFVFEQPAQHVFWMKGMHFSLDFIWLDQGKIVGVTKNALPEDPPHTFYSAPIPVKTVLEVPAGTVEKYDLKVGDKLDIEWNPE